SRTARAIPHPPAERAPRRVEPRGQAVADASRVIFSTPHRRCTFVASNVRAGSGARTRTAGAIAGLLRRLQVFSRGWRAVGVFRPAHASFGGGKRRPHRRRVEL